MEKASSMRDGLFAMPGAVSSGCHRAADTIIEENNEITDICNRSSQPGYGFSGVRHRLCRVEAQAGTKTCDCRHGWRYEPQTRYIIESLGLEPPQYLADVRPKVRHIVKPKPICATLDMPLRDALRCSWSQYRVLPVVDNDSKRWGSFLC